MQRVHYSAIVLIGGMLASTAVCAQGVSNIEKPDKADRTSGRGSALHAHLRTGATPHGFVRFCDATPAECTSDHGQESRFDASAERLKELDEVNRAVNKEIAPATDLEVYGVNEYWTLPRTRGDCEDYALQKRHNLVTKGWPVSALLMTVVRDEKGEGHAVLTARTGAGRLRPRQQDRGRARVEQDALPVRDAPVVPQPESLGCARHAARARWRPRYRVSRTRAPNKQRAGGSRLRSHARSKPLPILHVAPGGASETCRILIRQLADDLARRAEHHRARRDFLALGDQRIGADQAFLADLRPVENDRADANEAAAADRCSHAA